MDPELNKLLKWSITNSDASKGAEDEGNAVDAQKSNITPELIARLFGNQESDATLMCRYIAAVQHPEIELQDKLVAFDNFEQLIEGIDNAMNIESLGLWPDIISLLKHEEAEIRMYAAWAVGTAVQNNPKTQDQFLSKGAMPDLVALATTDVSPATRKKAVYAISSATRNHQPSLDELFKCLPESYQSIPQEYKTQRDTSDASQKEKDEDTIDAQGMKYMDYIMDKLRAHPVDASA